MDRENRPWGLLGADGCPLADTLHMLGGKHKPVLLHCLQSGEKHFLELQGLVLRRPKQDARNRVGYALSAQGRSLSVVLGQLFDWSVAHRAAIAAE